MKHISKEVNFSIAKLLKEKGYRDTAKCYNEEGKLVTVSLAVRRLNKEKIYYPVLSISDAIMWILKEHTILVGADMTCFCGELRFEPYYSIVKGEGTDTSVEKIDIQFITDDINKALEYAIKYVLKEKI